MSYVIMPQMTEKNPKLDPLRAGAIAGAFGLWGALMAEGIVFTWFDPWLGPLWNIGLGTPYLLLIFAVIGAALLAQTTPDELRQFFLPTTHRVRSLARRLYVVGASVIGAGITAYLGQSFIESFAQPISAAGAIVLTGLLVALFFFAFSKTKIAALCWILDRAPKQLTHPAAFWLALAVGWLGAHIVFYLVASESFAVIPWHFEAFLVAGVATSLLVFFLPRRAQNWMGGIGAVLAFGLAAFTFFALPKSGHGLLEGTVSAAMVDSMRDTWDSDGDGVLAFYGENDCAPDDPNIHPNAVDLPDNGIDENCNGIDLTLSDTKIVRGPVHVPVPKTVKNKTPHILLITTDALSMSRTSLGRNDRDTTPNLKAWAKDAIVFDNAFSSSNATRLSIPGLILGKHNLNVKFKVAKRHPYPYSKEKTLAERLQAADYHTVFVPGNKYFWRWGSVQRGFDEVLYDDIKKAKNPSHTAPEVTATIIDALEMRDPDKPLFLWAHYYDHHAPFNPSGKTFKDYGTSQADRFDSELTFADSHWKYVFEKIETALADEDYLVIFTSDHGEVFDREITKKTHSVFLDHEVLHVPLIVKVSGQPGKHVTSVVSHLDIVPTLANLVGWKKDPLWRGQSLLNVLYTDATKADGSIAVSVEYIPERVRKKKDPFDEIGIHTDQHFLRKRFQSPSSTTLFDWKTDPFNRTDLSSDDPETFEVLNAVALTEKEWLRRHEFALKGSKVDARPKPKKKAPKKSAQKQ